MRGQTYVIISIIFVIIIAVFAVTNVDAVEVNYLFWTAESPLILVILFSVLMGGLVAAAAGSIRLYQFRKKNKELENKIEIVQQQLDDAEEKLSNASDDSSPDQSE